jgi:hypothetical protein
MRKPVSLARLDPVLKFRRKLLARHAPLLVTDSALAMHPASPAKLSAGTNLVLGIGNADDDLAVALRITPSIRYSTY